jgi:ubiquinone/menaquinone biosynthesis C-methylase UbiE
LSARTFKKLTEQKIQETNRRQRDFFAQLIHVFDPPLPEGVPERLDEIVASARIGEGNTVLDVGTGTGILIPLIKAYKPALIYACDLSDVMLTHLKKRYPYARTLRADVRDLDLPSRSVDVVFLNACYPNITDKQRSFQNISRMIKWSGRVVVSHPMGKSFIDSLKERSPFPLDDFPDKAEAQTLFEPYGFHVEVFRDEPYLYILLLAMTRTTRR